MPLPPTSSDPKIVSLAFEHPEETQVGRQFADADRERFWTLVDWDGSSAGGTRQPPFQGDHNSIAAARRRDVSDETRPF